MLLKYSLYTAHSGRMLKLEKYGFHDFRTLWNWKQAPSFDSVWSTNPCLDMFWSELRLADRNKDFRENAHSFYRKQVTEFGLVQIERKQFSLSNGHISTQNRLRKLLSTSFPKCSTNYWSIKFFHSFTFPRCPLSNGENRISLATFVSKILRKYFLIKICFDPVLFDKCHSSSIGIRFENWLIVVVVVFADDKKDMKNVQSC